MPFMSRTFSIYEAKAKLSEIIRLVKSRHDVIVTERGVPVARIVPYRQSKEESLQSRIERFQSLGAILASKQDFDPMPLVRLEDAARRFLDHDRD